MLDRNEYVRSHGLGNDYIVVDGLRFGMELTPSRIRALCDRHRGIGSDGIVSLVGTSGSQFDVRIFNPDGSEAEKSGNALRIVAKFLFEHGYTTATEITIRVPAGIVHAELRLEGTRISAIRVEMGKAIIDTNLTQLRIVDSNLAVTAVSMGNPHCVVMCADLAEVDLFRTGQVIEKHAAFANRTNVQFAQVLSRSVVKILVWERGAGHTLASGSSACAVAAACAYQGLIDNEVTVQMEGGDLWIEILDGMQMRMTGPAEEICRGTTSAELLERLRLHE